MIILRHKQKEFSKPTRLSTTGVAYRMVRKSEGNVSSAIKRSKKKISKPELIEMKKAAKEAKLETGNATNIANTTTIVDFSNRRNSRSGRFDKTSGTTRSSKKKLKTHMVQQQTKRYYANGETTNFADSKGNILSTRVDNNIQGSLFDENGNKSKFNPGLTVSLRKRGPIE